MFNNPPTPTATAQFVTIRIPAITFAKIFHFHRLLKSHSSEIKTPHLKSSQSQRVAASFDVKTSSGISVRSSSCC